MVSWQPGPVCSRNVIIGFIDAVYSLSPACRQRTASRQHSTEFDEVKRAQIAALQEAYVNIWRCIVCTQKTS